MAQTIPKNQMKQILLAEDDEELRAVLSHGLQRHGYQVTECRHGMDLLDQLHCLDVPATPEDFDLIISDVRMPGVTGLSVLEGLSELEEAPPVILITAFGDADTHAAAERLGAVAMIDKPFELDDLLDHVRTAVAPGG